MDESLCIFYMTNLEIKINSFLIDINNILDELDIEDLDNKIKNLQNTIQGLRDKYKEQDEITRINELDEKLDTLLIILGQH